MTNDEGRRPVAVTATSDRNREAEDRDQPWSRRHRIETEKRRTENGRGHGDSFGVLNSEFHNFLFNNYISVEVEVELRGLVNTQCFPSRTMLNRQVDPYPTLFKVQVREDVNGHNASWKNQQDTYPL
ncbi:hypothetical protein ACFE04_028701 [Oxalis oulophora]